jgi:hypothetical protein
VAAVVAFVRIGVVNEVPAVPAVLTFELYHFTEPLAQLAVRVAVNPEQITVAVDADGGVGFGFTVMVPVALTVPHPPVNGILYPNVPDAVGVPLMVITLAAQAAVTPAGKPVAAPIPVAAVVACVILVNRVLLHNVGVVEAAPTVLFGVTVIVPVALTVPHPPVNGILYPNVPDAVGVPLIVITLAAHAAVTPAGKPVAAPIPVAPVVACVILVNRVLIHNVGVEDAAPAVLVTKV